MCVTLVMCMGDGGRIFEDGEMEERRMSGRVRIETVETETFSMDYFKFGLGKRAFVILPGLSVTSVTESADIIKKAYHAFADEYTVYVFDRRKELPPVYSVYEMAEDTAGALRALGLSRAYLFGASQGGMMAMEIAIRHPELVGRLVIGSTAAKASEELLQRVDEWTALAEKQDAEALYLAFGEALYPRNIFEQAKGLFSELAADVTKQDLKRFAVLAKGLKGFDILDELDKIRCPVLAIGDRDDRVTGAEAMESIAEHLKEQPDFELYMYEGCGHAVYDLAPDYKKRILRFLDAPGRL